MTEMIGHQIRLYFTINGEQITETLLTQYKSKDLKATTKENKCLCSNLNKTEQCIVWLEWIMHYV